MQKYPVGLVIGRFQPFHLGHKYLIEKALEHAQKIIIGIGSSNISNKDNPYDLAKRKKFLEKFITRSNIQNKILKIVSIKDVPDDEDWFELAAKQTGSVDVVIGDNAWVNGIYKAHGIKVIEVGHLKRKILQGTKIRQQMEKNKSWEDRVPEYLVSHIKKG